MHVTLKRRNRVPVDSETRTVRVPVHGADPTELCTYPHVVAYYETFESRKGTWMDADTQHDFSSVTVANVEGEGASDSQTPEPEPAPSAGRFSIRLFRLFGIPVFIHWSWYIVAIVQITLRRHDYGSVFWGAAEYLALFAIVLLHEFGHALACRSLRGKVDKIVLWPLGGAAFVAAPTSPGADLWISSAGPLVNLLLVPPTFALHWVTRHSSKDSGHFCEALLAINAGILVFNLLPIYPLDGGRILRAMLWFTVGRARSLLIASGLGVVGALGLGFLAFDLRDIWLGLLSLLVALGAGISIYVAILSLHEPDRRFARFRANFRRNRALIVTSTTFVLLIAGAGGIYIHTLRVDRQKLEERSDAKYDTIAEQARAIRSKDRAIARAEKTIAEHQSRETDNTRWIAILEARRQEAMKMEAVATAVNRFQSSMLSVADPDGVSPDRVTLLQVTEEALKKLNAGSLKEEPLAEAAVRDTLAGVLRSFGRSDEAEQVLRRGLELRRQPLQEAPNNTFHRQQQATARELAGLLEQSNRHEEAEIIRKDFELNVRETKSKAP